MWRNIFWSKCFWPLHFTVLGGSFLKEALRMLQTSVWQSLKPVSKSLNFLTFLGLPVNIKSRRVLYCDLKLVGSLTLSWRRPLSYRNQSFEIILGGAYKRSFILHSTGYMERCVSAISRNFLGHTWNCTCRSFCC